MSMHFQFDYRKTLQAAALLAKREPGRTISRMRLLKLLYICDREALKEIGRPITGDSFAALKKGPVVSEFYDMLKGESFHSKVFEKYFVCSGYHVTLIKAAGNGLLNRFEIRKLQEVSERFEKLDDDDLSELTHGFQEWQKNKPSGNSSRPIPPEDVLEALGRLDKVEQVRRNAALKAATSELWA